MTSRRTVLAHVVIMTTGVRAAAEPDKPTDFKIQAQALVPIHIDELGFFEGPLWVPGRPGYLLYSDIPGNTIWRWDAARGKKPLYRQIQRKVLPNVLDHPQTKRRMIGSNGLALDPAGRVNYCVFGGARIERVQDGNSRQTVVAGTAREPMTYPNDLVFRSDGILYFSEHRGLYMWNGRQRRRLNGPEHPNGLAFSPDERFLYVTEHPSQVYRYDVRGDGTLSARALFVELGADKSFDPNVSFVDGLKVDASGRLWAVGTGGVVIVNPDGTRVGNVVAPRQRFTNIAFGGDSNDKVFLTAPEGIYWATVPASKR